jgi:N-methylhydantoinase A/oxoprolinase/acetone carboxylase beta subunit
MSKPGPTLSSATGLTSTDRRLLVLGVDIGGTFTDFAGITESGTLIDLKVPTTPHGLETAVDAGIRMLAADGFRIGAVHHGTTVATNALIEGTLARTALLCTKGFRDILELRRLWRERLFGYDWDRPEPLVPRALRFEIDERIGPSGEVLRALDEQQVRSVAVRLRELGIESVAVALLFSFRNSSHEDRIVEILQEELPDASVCSSAEVLPEIHEYERTATTTVNALIRPVIASYLARVECSLSTLGVGGPFRLVRSDGALMSPEVAKAQPFRMIHSGPAAGVIAAGLIGSTEGWKHLLTLDMGGTSTDVALVWDGEPLRTLESDIRWNTPVRGSQIDVRSIGAGGGSVVGVEAGGLFVGPESASSVPGPACYGRGGSRATVTDALVVLGALPTALLGGDLRLDVEGAEAAVGQALPDFSSPITAAEAVYTLSLQKMAVLMREVTINRGYDPRLCTLVCFGGAAGVFAADLARELEMSRVCIPLGSSVLSALGAALSRPVSEALLGTSERVERLSPALLRGMVDAAAKKASAGLVDAGVEVVHLIIEADLKYRSQPETLTVILEASMTDQELITGFIERFHQDHFRLYHLDRRPEPVDLMTIRARAFGPETIGNWQLTHVRDGHSPDVQPDARTRPWYRNGEAINHVPILDPTEIVSPVDGPAFIEDAYTTLAVPPGDVVSRGRSNSMIIEVSR